MLAIHSASQGVDSVRALVVVSLILLAVFRRVVLQILIVILGVLLLVGAFEVLQGFLQGLR